MFGYIIPLLGLIDDHWHAVNDALIAIAVLGLLAGGAIVVLDTLILRRVRRQRVDQQERESPGDTPRR